MFNTDRWMLKANSMIKSAVTISLVEQARGGPFVFWDDLAAGCHAAGKLGYDAVEVFAPGPEAVDVAELRKLLDDCGLQLAAVGTGAGWVIHKSHLVSGDADQRDRAKQFIRSIIDMGGPFGAPAIIGSMQGRWSEAVDRETAMGYLSDAVNELGQHARQYNTPLIYEPINRYESNMINSVTNGVEFLKSIGNDNVKLLADLFHMNIEDVDIAASIRDSAGYIGHVHFVDSNRRPAGCGHIDFAPIAAALKEINYNRYASAEALPWPDSNEAARLTIEAFKKHFG